jgi:hypothetical protein
MWDRKRKCQYVILKKCGTEKKMSICNSKKMWDWKRKNMESQYVILKFKKNIYCQ